MEGGRERDREGVRREGREMEAGRGEGDRKAGKHLQGSASTDCASSPSQRANGREVLAGRPHPYQHHKTVREPVMDVSSSQQAGSNLADVAAMRPQLPLIRAKCGFPHELQPVQPITPQCTSWHRASQATVQ